MTLRNALLAGALGVVGSSWCAWTPAMARPTPDTAASTEAEAEKPAAVSAVTVTGTRATLEEPAENGALGSKKLLDTPYSITVVGSEDIEKRQATSIAQIFAHDPAVFSFAPAATTNWWGTQIRGLGVRNYYIDDVPLLLYWGGDFPLESIDSVQALKGLSGFMYGFGAPGGVIAYRTKRPTAEPLLTTEVGYRNDSVLFAHLDASGPLGREGGLGYRVNLAGENGTAYNGAGVNRLTGSLALEYQISPDLNWYATFTAERSNLQEEPLQLYWSAYSGAVLPRPTYDYKNFRIADSFYKSDTEAFATGLDWKVSDAWSADFTYGFTRKKHRSNKMFAYMLNQAGDYEGYVYTFAELDENTFAQAMLKGDFATGPIRHEIVAGASYMTYTSDFGAGSHWSNDFNGNIHERQPFRANTDIDFGTQGWPFDERQTAVFASDTLHLGPHWQAVLGVRRTKYVQPDVDGDPGADSRYETTATTPTVALIYKPADYVSIYGSYVESMEGGARVGGEYANAGEVLQATVSKQQEAGVKYEHGRLGLTAAAFRVERANQIDSLVDGLRYLTQDGLTLYKGVEVSGDYQLNEDLRLGLGAIHLDPTITDVSPENESLRGNIPAEAARWQVTANAEYAVPAVEGLSFHGDARYYGKAPTDDANGLFIPSRTLVNLGFRYETRISGQRVAFTGNVNNVFNKKYWGLSNIGEGVNGALSAKVYW
jgi:iron complex outermembrane receptor protein